MGDLSSWYSILLQEHILGISETRHQSRTKCMNSLGCAEIESMPTRACNIREGIQLLAKHRCVHNFSFYKVRRIKLVRRVSQTLVAFINVVSLNKG